MAHLDQKEIFWLERPWEVPLRTLYLRSRFLTRPLLSPTRQCWSNLTVKNIEYFLEFCLTDILDTFKELKITEGKDKFCIIRKVLVGTARPVWDKVVREHYERDTQKNVSGAVLEAIGFFLESFLNCEYAQDANWRYFRNCKKGLLITPEHHERQVT